jgi:transglutaminase-like putative cysteine protease
MWLSIEHVTRFTYEAPINEAYTEIRLKPLHGDGQRCSSFGLETEPRDAKIDAYRDSFGNTVHHFDVLEPHETLSVTVRSEVWTPEAFADDQGPPSPLDHWDFLRESLYVPVGGAVTELASTVDRSPATLDHALALVAAVRSRMRYEPGATNVHTRADEALADGRGVCQDFAHVLIGLSRAHGIPARYVSGYLFAPGVDETASHGWVDMLVDGAWVALDPTHDRLQTDHYVRVAVGRDYADVPPTRGVYKGKARERLDVEVAVRAIA